MKLLGVLALSSVLSCSPRSAVSGPLSAAAPSPSPTLTTAVPAKHAEAVPNVSPQPTQEPSRFVRVFDGKCGEGLLQDLGTRTLWSTSQQVRIIEPGQRWEDGTDVSAGLPAKHGLGTIFSLNPMVIDLDLREDADDAASGRRLFRFDGTAWTPLDKDFGDFVTTLPVEEGSVVIGWAHDPKGDPQLVPAGNLTRAKLLTTDGKVLPLPNWPALMTWDYRSTPGVLWATATKPRQPGKFLLRMPLHGAAKLFAIPGIEACRGVERLTQLAMLQGVTDDEAHVIIEAGDCVKKSAPGVYRFEMKGARWHREGDTPAWQEPTAEQGVTAQGASFNVAHGEVIVTQNGKTEHHAVEGLELPARSWEGDGLTVTASGSEVWLWVRGEPRCSLYRYQWSL